MIKKQLGGWEVRYYKKLTKERNQREKVKNTSFLLSTMPREKGHTEKRGKTTEVNIKTQERRRGRLAKDKE